MTIKDVFDVVLNGLTLEDKEKLIRELGKKIKEEKVAQKE